MRKSIIIIMLCALQGACAYSGQGQPGAVPLLSYTELGTEIKVTRIVIEEDTDAASADAP